MTDATKTNFDLELESNKNGGALQLILSCPSLAGLSGLKTRNPVQAECTKDFVRPPVSGFGYSLPSA